MSTTDIPKSITLVEKAGWFVAGFAVIASLQATTGWWLNSGTGVLRAVLVLLALGGFAAVWRPPSPWVRAGALWAGAISGSAAVLFWMGPGTIWPIVLAAAAGLTAGAVFGGAFLGSVLTGFRR